jgi:phosphoglycolate phosphatase
MLSALKSHGVKVAVFSHKPHEFTTLLVNEFFPCGIFPIIYGQRYIYGQPDGFPKKPDPTLALEIAKLFDVRPQDTLFVGDSGVDIMTGKTADMMTASVSWGFLSVQELTDNKTDIIVHNPLELEQYVLFPT